MKEIINSVGIDIGTSTTQLIFSKLTIENLASSYTVPRISIVNTEVVYRSDIYFTPLTDKSTIDAAQVKRIVESEYDKAKMNKQDLQTGAVIITGETARKENANDVLNALSHMAGDFVVATAGPDLESVLSAKGAGTDVIKIRGVKVMHGADYAIIPDQIEAGTFMVAAAATRGDIVIKNVIPKHLESITSKLRVIGANVEEFDDYVHVTGAKEYQATNIKTLTRVSPRICNL